MTYERFLPSNLMRGNLAAVIGLISDTHMPMRRRVLPPNLGEVLGGVDLLLHAGDVGELWVLDQLSAIAPVIAVHGNDDSDDAQRELPYQQIVTITGQRILLWHSHFPDWEEEMASRVYNDLRRSIHRSIDRARRVEAKIVVFGHWHIPLVHQTAGCLIINPGALASGNEFTRMLLNSVALLFLEKNGTSHVVHINLAAPDAPYVPKFDWNAGFDVVGRQFAKSIVSPELAPFIPVLRANLSRSELLTLRGPIASRAIPIWERERGELTLADVEDLLLNDTSLPTELRERVLSLWETWRSHS